VKFEEGKLYKCSDHYILMIYPTRENAVAGNSVGSQWGCESRLLAVVKSVAEAADQAAIYWSKELGCSVRCSEPDEIFIFIKEEIIEEHKYLNVLFGDKHGWIVYKGWLEITKAKTNEI